MLLPKLTVLLANVAILAVVATAFVEPQAACSGSSQGCPYDCSPSSEDGLQSECWDFLNMTGYINEWVAENGTKAGIKDIGFAQAYLAYSVGRTHKTQKTCDLISSNTCDAPDPEAQYENAQQFYTLYNIYAVNQFYNQFSSALTASQGLASTKLDKIVNMVAPPVEHQVSTPMWYTILTTALFYAGFATAPVGTVFGDKAALASSLIVNGVWAARSTPPLGQAKSGYTQTAEARFTTLADVGSDLTDIVKGYQSQIEKEVEIMQGDAEAFIALCSPGGFSERVTLSQVDQSLDLYKSLELFVLSESLTASGIVITKSTGIDPRTVPAISCPGFGPAGNCYSWYYGNGNTYAFHDPKNYGRDFTDLINFIWDEGFVDSLSDVFANEACQGKTPSLDIQKPDPAAICAMNTKQCEFYYSTDTALSISKEYTNCDTAADYMKVCGKFFDTSPSYKLPLAYLGPQLKKGKFCR